jgi:hypothetical protein
MLVLAVVAVTALGMGQTAAAPTSRTGSGDCTAKGARVTVGSRTTTTYSIEKDGVTCAFAKPWVNRLSYERVDPTSGEISGGPPGWDCQRGGRPEKRAEVGSCSHSTATRSLYFSWQPSFPASSGECTTKGARVRLKGYRPSTTYVIFEIHGVTCAFAKPWVTRLSYRQVDPITRRISGGPPGWTCYGAGSEKRAENGDCATHTGTSRFYWSAIFGR